MSDYTDEYEHDRTGDYAGPSQRGASRYDPWPGAVVQHGQPSIQVRTLGALLVPCCSC
jgi:hypothetical protein